MKRGPGPKRTQGLKRGEKPLERSTPLARGDKPLSRSTRLGRALVQAQRRTQLATRPKPKPSVDEQMAAAQWIAVVVPLHGARCALCGLEAMPGRRVARDGTRLQGHHVIEQQRLEAVAKKRGIPAWYLLWDDRNGMCLCEPCHARHTSAHRRVPFRLLTPQNIAFASDLGLDWVLERFYPR